MQIMINALNDMPISNNKVSGVNEIGVLMGNSLMFQRFPTHDGFEDPQFSNFYGQTLPLVKRGIPVQTVHMENLSYEATLKDIKVLVMSYSNMKPTNSKLHEELKKWVTNGGILIYVGRDDDPYQKVSEWWNSGENKYTTPAEHLFKTLNIKVTNTKDVFDIGKGSIYILRENPKEFVLINQNDKDYLNTIKKAYNKATNGKELELKNSLYLQRGPYKIVSVMDESTSNAPFIIEGPVIDLFDPTLPILAEKIVAPNTQAFLYDINTIIAKKEPKVLTSASKISNQETTENSYSFISKSPLNTTNVMRILLPKKPLETKLLDSEERMITSYKSNWDTKTNTLWLEFSNSNEGVHINLVW
tara:strand:- start:692 stop:1768 length:1077 start_codon:yes stop_codon:yes gene_type:complete